MTEELGKGFEKGTLGLCLHPFLEETLSLLDVGENGNNIIRNNYKEKGVKQTRPT